MTNSRSEKVYDALLRALVDGEYRTGDCLPSENELSERFKVSRNTVRTAINKLNVLGFAETRHGGGTFIKNMGGDAYLNFFLPALMMNAKRLIDVMELRKGLEVQAVKLAAMRADADDVRLLKAALRRSQKHLRDMERFAFHNTEFHTLIAKTSHNNMFAKMMEIIRSITMTKMQAFLVTQGHDIDSDFYHSTILQCIINRKPDEAAVMMDRHLALVIERVESYDAGQRRQLAR